MSEMSKQVHMGDILREILEEQGRSHIWLAQRIKKRDGTLGITPQSVYNMLKTVRLSEYRIQEIDRVLGINFRKEVFKRMHPHLQIVEDAEPTYNKTQSNFLDLLEELLTVAHDMSEEDIKAMTKKLKEL